MSAYSARPRRRKSWSFEQLESRHYFSATPLAPGWTSISSNTPEGAQAILDRELAWAIAQYVNQQGLSTRVASTNALPTDTLFASQWHLLNTGQSVGSGDFQTILGKPGEDINIVPAWNRGYTGAGVVVAVVDSGVQYTHPDLISNINFGLQFDAITGDFDAAPDLLDPGNAHGTAVAGLIAAANNGIGVVGVAYGSQIVPIRLIDSLAPVGLGGPEIVSALRYANNQIDIYNHSWGPAAARLAYSLSPLEVDALRNSVLYGRGGNQSLGIRGLGNIHVFSSGNDAQNTGPAGFPFGAGYDSSSYNGFANSRYTIAVGGVDHDGSYNNVDGSVTNYMEAGASLLVVAPTGSIGINIADDDIIGSGIWTTDPMGDDGYNMAPLPNGDELELPRDYLGDTNYTSRFNGTSASAPIVSGVIALMLEANPNLTYRDVQEILVRSARQVGQFEIPQIGGGPVYSNLNSWIINPQPFYVNPDPFIPGAPGEPAVPDDPDTPEDETLPEIPPGVSNTGDPAVIYPRYQVFDMAAVDAFTGAVINYDTYKPPRPTMFANGAGYTVSQGRGVYGEMFGYGHGAIDAEMAVLLAEQWHEKGQNLPEELTWTTFWVPPIVGSGTIAAGGVGTPASGNLVVPGGIGGGGNFVAYESEYYDMTPFGPYTGPAGTARGGFYRFTVPDTVDSAMSMEWVEVKLDITAAGGNADALDFMRIALVSPNGTVSELNNYFDIFPGNNGTRQVPSHPGFVTNPPGAISAEGNFIYTFSTNRHWGERYDEQYIIDPLSGNPFLDNFGQAVRHGWELHFENFSGTQFTINGIELTWHGRPIAPNTQRIQGAIGVDSGRNGVGVNDNFFNFNRYFQSAFNFDNDWVDLIPNGRRDYDDANGNRVQDPGEEFVEPLSFDVNEIFRTADPFQEEFAANITVTARRLDGSVAAQFVTGADGNYYFDLVPGDYIISIEDPDGRLAKDENLLGGVPANRLAHYKQEWRISEEWFYAPRVDSSVQNDFRVITNASGTPVPYTVGLNTRLPSAVKNLNFLLEGKVDVEFTGNVFADIAGDGQFNGDDVAAPGFIVFVDANGSGQFEAAEDPFTITDVSGNYTINLSSISGPQALVIGAVPSDAGWVPSSPANARQVAFVTPGDAVSGLNFAFRPVSGSGDAAGNATGSILGVAFNDLNGDGLRGATDTPIAGLRVFHDIDASGTWDAGEPFAFTAANGAYFLANVTPGQVRLDIELGPLMTLTNPSAGFRNVNLLSDGVLTNINWGLRNFAVNDWGDLAGYPTLLSENGPRHALVSGFRLGARADGELDGQPTANADGDDLAGGQDDEDGVILFSNGGLLQPGENVFRITVQGAGGFLNGWIDWNNDGDWDDAGEQVFVNVHVNEGPNGTLVPQAFTVMAPANMAGGPLAARFRWGSQNISYVGADVIGEVEDYRLPNSLQPTIIYPAGDYDRSGVVDRDDYLLWKQLYGTDDLRADGNGDGQVNTADYNVWRKNLGAHATAGAGAVVVGQSQFATNSFLGSGASSANSTNPAVARAAAVARALAVESLQSGQGALPAGALPYGLVPITIRVGNGTQTVLTFAPPASANPPSAAAPQVDPLALAIASFRSNWLDARSGAIGNEAVGLPARVGPALSTAVADVASQLLDTVWSAYDEPAWDIEIGPIGDAESKKSDECSELAFHALFAGHGLSSDI